MKLTKNKWVNLVILKTIETASLCFVPFWIGKLSRWLAFRSFGDGIAWIWLEGIALIVYFAAGCCFIFLMTMGVHFSIKQNIRWAKKLVKEDKRNT